MAQQPEATVRAHLELDETGLEPLARLLICTGRLYQSITAQTIGALTPTEANAFIAWQGAINDLNAGFIMRPTPQTDPPAAPAQPEEGTE